MTLMADSLINLISQGDKSHIKLTNKTLAAIDKIGNMQLHCGLILINVLVVSNFQLNLLLVVKIAKDNNCVSSEFYLI